MASGGILALLGGSKGKGASGPVKSPGGTDAPDSPEPLDDKAAALESMWANMKAGDFKAAAMDFHDAYMACQKAEADEESGEMEMGDEAGEMEA